MTPSSNPSIGPKRMRGPLGNGYRLGRPVRLDSDPTGAGRATTIATIKGKTNHHRRRSTPEMAAQRQPYTVVSQRAPAGTPSGRSRCLPSGARSTSPAAVVNHRLATVAASGHRDRAGCAADHDAPQQIGCHGAVIPVVNAARWR